MISQTCAQKSGVFSGIVDIRQSTLAGSAYEKAPAIAEARDRKQTARSRRLLPLYRGSITAKDHPERLICFERIFR
jgi:hypothetical protein